MEHLYVESYVGRVTTIEQLLTSLPGEDDLGHPRLRMFFPRLTEEESPIVKRLKDEGWEPQLPNPIDIAIDAENPADDPRESIEAWKRCAHVLQAFKRPENYGE